MKVAAIRQNSAQSRASAAQCANSSLPANSEQVREFASHSWAQRKQVSIHVCSASVSMMPTSWGLGRTVARQLRAIRRDTCPINCSSGSIHYRSHFAVGSAANSVKRSFTPGISRAAFSLYTFLSTSSGKSTP